MIQKVGFVFYVIWWQGDVACYARYVSVQVLNCLVRMVGHRTNLASSSTLVLRKRYQFFHCLVAIQARTEVRRELRGGCFPKPRGAFEFRRRPNWHRKIERRDDGERRDESICLPHHKKTRQHRKQCSSITTTPKNSVPFISPLISLCQPRMHTAYITALF